MTLEGILNKCLFSWLLLWITKITIPIIIISTPRGGRFRRGNHFHRSVTNNVQPYDDGRREMVRDQAVTAVYANIPHLSSSGSVRFS